MTARDLAEIAAAAVSITGAVGGGVWWLVWPRLRSQLEEVVRSVGRVEEATAGDRPDTLSRHARVAAGAASDVRELRGDVTSLTEKLTEYEEWQSTTDRRLGKLEEAIMALLSRDLWTRIREDGPQQDQN